MDRWFLEYKPEAGFLHHWLVAGPQLIATDKIAVDKKEGALALDRRQLTTRYWQDSNEISTPPSELAKFTLAAPEGASQELTWRYLACEDDHLLDLAGDYPPRNYLRAWAYTEIVSPVAQKAMLTLHLFGPAQLWLNSEPVLQQTSYHRNLSAGLVAEVQLEAGANPLLLRLEQFVAGAVPFGAALHIKGITKDTLKVRVPTNNADTKKQQSIERLAQRAYLERDLYAGKETVTVKWPSSIQAERKLMLRVQTPADFVSTQMEPVVKAGLAQRVTEASSAKDGAYKIRVMAEFDDFVRGFRVHHDLHVNLLHSDYSATPEGELSARAIEMAQHAAWWSDGLFSEMASMLLGLWKQVNDGKLRRIMDGALAGGEDSYFVMTGLLLMAYRYSSFDDFPPALAQRLEECILAFDYGEGSAQATAGSAAFEEDSAILRHVCNSLAGQLYGGRRFSHSGQLGEWHQQRGEEGVIAWLVRRAKGGFAAWDSSEAFEAMLLALVTLVDYTASEELSEMAAAIADKILTSLAINSYKGVFGSSHGATQAASITDGRMERTSSLTRLLWGVGCWNQHMAAAMALAGSQKYGCPTLLQMIAFDPAEELWSRERHIVGWGGATDVAGATAEVNKVTYRTPDYMLCSAQDYRAGEAGLNEHIWQATLSPSAVVFVNHPGCMSQAPAYRPNFWCGNVTLPRVAQWRDVLIALHHLPDDDWLGYTHAHFPIAAFDEQVIRRGWAFARQGDGYLALTASGGLTLVKEGPGAYREVRSLATKNVWFCHMGRKAQDGTFAAFQKAILALPINFNVMGKAASANFGVDLKTLRGDAMTFSWSGALTVNGEEQPLGGFKHYESPYTVSELGADDMEVRYKEWLLKLNFAAEEE